MKLNVIVPSLQGTKKKAQQQQLVRSLNVDLTALIEGAIANWEFLTASTVDEQDALEHVGRTFKEFFSDVEDFKKYHLLLRVLFGVLIDVQQAIQNEVAPVAAAVGIESFMVKILESLDGAVLLEVHDIEASRESIETPPTVPNHHADRGRIA